MDKTMHSPSALRWYLIHCKPRQDARALENLERQGFECFWPLRRVERLQAGRRRALEEALFPSYLFIRLGGINDNWAPICSTRGVHRIVRFNEYPVPVADALIAAIRRRMSEEIEPQPYLTARERVVIAEGSFSQVEAIFLAKDGDSRVVLLLDVLGREQRISFPQSSVRKLG